MTISVVAASESGVSAIQVSTLIIAALAALGAWLAAMTARRVDSNENERARELSTLNTSVDRQVRQSHENDSWTRDHVTLRYQELLAALGNVNRIGVEDVYEARKARAEFTHALTAALVVARRRVQPIAEELLNGLDLRVFTPLARRSGIPAPAYERLQNEREYVTAMHTMLLTAMRADLGLLDPSAEASLIFEIKEMQTTGQTDRSTAAGSSFDELIDLLAAFGVTPIVGARNDYAMSEELLIRCEDLYGEACPTFEAVIRQMGGEIHLAVRPDLGEERTKDIYDIAVRFVETGLRGGIHRRDGYDGSSLFLIDPSHRAGLHRV